MVGTDMWWDFHFLKPLIFDESVAGSRYEACQWVEYTLAQTVTDRFMQFFFFLF